MELTRFQKKALDYSKHISLTANAGSGKTFILSKRYVEIACNEKIDLKNIVAITFTEKAASELYKRIAKEIDERYNSDIDSDKKRKLNRIRRQLVSANISTIHSFCISVLKEYPLEAGIDANFSPIDPIISKELIELSINDYLNKNLTDDLNQDLRELLRIFGNKSVFTNQVYRLIEKRKKIVSISEKLYTKSIEEVADFLNKSFDYFYEKILEENIDDFCQSLKIINQRVLSDKPDNQIGIEINYLLAKLSEAENVDERCMTLKELSEHLLTQKGQIRSQGYLKKNLAEDFENEIEVVELYFEKINSFEIPEQRELREMELAEFGKKLSRVFLEINKIYEQKKQLNGFLDFEDILILAKQTLLNETVKQKLGEKFKYIMIDEYQDTNEIQYEIFMPILNNLKQGNLFVVGDEKQSIYKFRDADLELFQRTKDDIKNETDEDSLLMLPHSFRVSPPVALFANKLFDELFKSPNLIYNEVAASDLICANMEKKGHIEFLLAQKDESLSETELTARRILKLKNEDQEIGLSDIAVLCRKRNSFEDLELTFNKYNIPFKIIGGKGFYQQQLVMDIYNYLAFITNSQNDLALVGILRSPFFNISDNDIYKISLEKGNTFFIKLNNYSASNSGMFEGKIKTLKENISLINKIEIGKIIRKILNESGYWSIIAYAKDSEQDIANLQKLIRIANSFSNQSYKTIFDFLEFLKDSIDSHSDEGQAAVDSGNDAVQIMTIHQSKGLEFKAVFLFNCNDVTNNDKIKAKSISIDNNFGVLTKLPPKDNYFVKYEAAPIVSMFDFIESKKEIAEVKRLLYVAVTRAVNYLFITAEKNKSFRKNSFIDLIIRALNVDVEDGKISLSGQISYLRDSNTDIETNLKIEIPIVKQLEYEESAEREIKENKEQIKYLSDEITDYAKREIISASKVAVFSQCQRKYELTYEFGYSKLFMKFYDLINNYEYQSKEEDNAGSLSAVKGRVIHKVLENEIPVNGIEEVVKKYVDEEVKVLVHSSSEIEDLVDNILSDINIFYKSSAYNFVKGFNNYQNEFEVYTKEDENYLYGIIDKLVFDKDKAIIIDYKTDLIEENEINERGNIYLPQLEFYAYLIAKLYTGINNFEVRLIFIKHPEKNYVKNFNREEIKKFKSSIQSYVNAIKNQSFSINTKHCHKCYFFLNKKMCIYDKVNK